MRPAELLRKHGLRPKKEWGQNFLGDERILDELARLARVGPDDTVVELGAGLGHFTRALAATGARVVAVERDRELAPILRAELPKVEVAEADAKSFDLKAISARAGKRIVLCGNLPYHLSSPILFHLLDQQAQRHHRQVPPAEFSRDVPVERVEQAVQAGGPDPHPLRRGRGPRRVHHLADPVVVLCGRCRSRW